MSKMKVVTTVKSCKLVKGGAKFEFAKIKLTTGQRGEIGKIIDNAEQVHLTIEAIQRKLPLEDQQAT